MDTVLLPKVIFRSTIVPMANVESKSGGDPNVESANDHLKKALVAFLESGGVVFVAKFFRPAILALLYTVPKTIYEAVSGITQKSEPQH
jgi:hypothetical protein